MYLGAIFGSRNTERASGSGGSVSGGAAGKIIGPFPESQGCPPGSAIMHRYGSGTRKMVQCRILGGGGSSGQPIRTRDPVNITTNISPTMQQSFTPQSSPVIQPIINSPGSSASGSPTQSAPSPQTSSSGGDSAALEAARKREIELQERLYQQQLSAQAQAAQAAQRLAAQREAANKAEYQALLNKQTEAFNKELEKAAQATRQNSPPPQYEAGAPIIPAEKSEKTEKTEKTAQEKTEFLPYWLLPALIAGGLGVIILSNEKTRRKK